MAVARVVLSRFVPFLLCAAVFAHPLYAAGESLVLQSTTSTQNSGLYDVLLPAFTGETGIEVHVVAVGTGQALKNARNGDGDVLIVHDKSAEEEFVRRGYGLQRFDLMYNDFVLVGPKANPAEIQPHDSAAEALAKIAQHQASFLSRGDDSGTHKKEQRLWQAAAIDPLPNSGKWYREAGSGMGATLNAAIGMGAYTLADRATWIKFANKRDFTILTEGDERLFNQYGVILVNPDQHPHVKYREGKRLVDWLLSDEGQAVIAGYNVNGQQLFFPNASPSS